MNGQELQELLNRWQSGRSVPYAESFQPTSDMPVMRVQIGDPNEFGCSIWAYGVVYFGWSVDGSPLYYRSWAWFLNRDDALRRQLTEEYRHSDAGRTWTSSRPEKQDECTHVERREIGVVDNKPVVVFRYAKCKEGYPLHWRIGCDADEVRREQRCTLWYFSGSRNAPAIEYPNPEDPKAQFPEIVFYHYGTCPETGEDLYRYGMFQDDSGSEHKTRWFETIEQARQVRAEEEKLYRESQVYFQLRRDQQTAERVHMEVRGTEDALKALPWYAATRTMVDPSILAAYDALWLEWPEPGKVDPVEHMAQCAAFEAAVSALRLAVDEAYLTRALACDERGLGGRVTTFLDHWCPTCPLCGQKYQRGDFEVVLVTGELLITKCECPERGWDEKMQDAPTIIKDVQQTERSCLFYRDRISELRSRSLHDERSVTTIFDVRYGKVVLMQFVLVHHNLRLLPALLIDTNAWLGLPLSQSVVPAQCTFDPVWHRVTLPAVQAARYQYEEECVEDGTVMKISFQLGEKSGRYYADVSTSSGRRRFVVDPQRCTFPVEAGVTYYCTVGPLSDKWWPGMTEYVYPHLAVPVTARRTQQAPKSKGSLGTFAELLQSKVTK